MKDAFSPSWSADSSCQHCSNWPSVMTGRALTRIAQGHAEWLRGIRPPLLVKQGLMKHSAPPNSHPRTSECWLMTSVSVVPTCRPRAWQGKRVALFFLYTAVVPLAWPWMGRMTTWWPPPTPIHLNETKHFMLFSKCMWLNESVLTVFFCQL